MVVKNLLSQKNANTIGATINAGSKVGQIASGAYTFYKGYNKQIQKETYKGLMWSGAVGGLPAILTAGIGIYSHQDKVKVNQKYTLLINNLEKAFNSLPEPMVFLQELNNYQPEKANFADTSDKALLVSKYSSLWSITNSSLKQIERLNEQINDNLHKQIRCFATISRIFEGDGAKTIDMAMACRTWILDNLVYELLDDEKKAITIDSIKNKITIFNLMVTRKKAVELGKQQRNDNPFNEIDTESNLQSLNAKPRKQGTKFCLQQRDLKQDFQVIHIERSQQNQTRPSDS
ncbi:hypothetical protein QL989_03660 [Pseudoalteromonas sp. APC 3224]|uniref:hypothetical protein n=1 Tax=Pseudoalteromonas sp. APC 3224 TaxID=3035203 RepID=UPI0025B4FEEB|nr:hypothetical protein [Pseudoalteromonas sp. APC 3224]MDN3484438.1 hypothetical protein [Pseudoalteromonas sp. APC 3224]